MKAIAGFLLLLCTVFSLSSCSFRYERPEEVVQWLDSMAAQIGRSQLTEDENLLGERCCHDAYTGDYQAACSGNTGRDVVFGGASIEPRKLRVYGMVSATSGRAVVRIRQNEQVTELEPQEDGRFETTVSCASGGNYVMVDYENFQGDVELHAEYVPDASEQEF